MYAGQLVFAQLMDHLPWQRFRRILERYGADRRIREFSCAAWPSRSSRTARACATSDLRAKRRYGHGCLESRRIIADRLALMGGRITGQIYAEAHRYRTPGIKRPGTMRKRGAECFQPVAMKTDPVDERLRLRQTMDPRWLCPNFAAWGDASRFDETKPQRGQRGQATSFLVQTCRQSHLVGKRQAGDRHRVINPLQRDQPASKRECIREA